MPVVLKDALSKVKYETLKNALTNMTPKSVFEALPVCLPHTYRHAFDFNGQNIVLKGVSKYPLTQWTEKGQPYMTAERWRRFCMKIAEGDMEHLDLVAVAAEKATNAAGGSGLTAYSSSWVEV